jgi:NAD(P)-dependent dehydrogenase (short-subunit alcohol dehydrogenase family)
MNIVIIGTSRGIGLELVRTFLSGGHKIAAGIRGPRVSPALESLQGAYRRDKLFVFPAIIRDIPGIP